MCFAPQELVSSLTKLFFVLPCDSALLRLLILLLDGQSNSHATPTPKPPPQGKFKSNPNVNGINSSLKTLSRSRGMCFDVTIWTFDLQKSFEIIRDNESKVEVSLVPQLYTQFNTLLLITATNCPLATTETSQVVSHLCERCQLWSRWTQRQAGEDRWEAGVISLNTQTHETS